MKILTSAAALLFVPTNLRAALNKDRPGAVVGILVGGLGIVLGGLLAPAGRRPVGV